MAPSELAFFTLQLKMYTVGHASAGRLYNVLKYIGSDIVKPYQTSWVNNFHDW